MNSEFGVLGKAVPISQGYNASLLFPIKRSAYPVSERNAVLGDDVWNAYELSWLSPEGLAQQAWLRLVVSAHSTHIIESKSLKLYLTAFNSERLTRTELLQTIESDFSVHLGEQFSIYLKPLNTLPRALMPEGFDLSEQCDEALTMAANWLVKARSADEALLQQYSAHATDVKEDAQGVKRYVYSRFRSLCPVTAQPDWATVIIQQQGATIDSVALLAYLESFRNHQDFHEHCVESIFDQLKAAFNPKQLSVQALFSRRGGLDINPFRASNQQLKAFPNRVFMQ